jgi:hypothetical protein
MTTLNPRQMRGRVKQKAAAVGRFLRQNAKELASLAACVKILVEIYKLLHG